MNDVSKQPCKVGPRTLEASSMRKSILINMGSHKGGFVKDGKYWESNSQSPTFHHFFINEGNWHLYTVRKNQLHLDFVLVELGRAKIKSKIFPLVDRPRVVFSSCIYVTPLRENTRTPKNVNLIE